MLAVTIAIIYLIVGILMVAINEAHIEGMVSDSSVTHLTTEDDSRFTWPARIFMIILWLPLLVISFIGMVFSR